MTRTYATRPVFASHATNRITAASSTNFARCIGIARRFSSLTGSDCHTKVLVDVMDDRVPSAARDQPGVHGNCDHEGDPKAESEAPPEESVRKAGSHRAWNDEQEDVVHRLHGR